MKRLSKAADSFRRGPSSAPMSIDDQSNHSLSSATNSSNHNPKQPSVKFRRPSFTDSIGGSLHGFSSRTLGRNKTAAAPKQLHDDMDVQLSSKAAASNRRMSVSLRERSVRLLDNSSHSHASSTPPLPPRKAPKAPPKPARRNRRASTGEADDGLPALTRTVAINEEEEHRYAGVKTLAESTNKNKTTGQQRGRRATIATKSSQKVVPDNIKVAKNNDTKTKNEKPPKPTRKKPTRQRSSSLSELRVPRRDRANNKKDNKTTPATKSSSSATTTSTINDNNNYLQFSNGFVRDSGAALDRIKAQNKATKERLQKKKQQEKYKKRKQQHTGEAKENNATSTTKKGGVKGNNSASANEGQLKEEHANGDEPKVCNKMLFQMLLAQNMPPAFTLAKNKDDNNDTAPNAPKNMDQDTTGTFANGGKQQNMKKNPPAVITDTPANKDDVAQNVPKNIEQDNASDPTGTIANGGRQQSMVEAPPALTPAKDVDDTAQKNDRLCSDGTNELPVGDKNDNDDATALVASQTDNSVAVSKIDAVVEKSGPASDTSDTTGEVTVLSAESTVDNDEDATPAAVSNNKDETHNNNGGPVFDSTLTAESTTPSIVGDDAKMKEAPRAAEDNETQTDDDPGSSPATTTAEPSDSSAAVVAAAATTKPTDNATATTKDSEQPTEEKRGRTKATRKRPARQRSRSLTSMGTLLRGGKRSDRAETTSSTSTRHNETTTPVVKKKTHTFYFDDDYRDNDPIVKLDSTEVEQQVQKLRDKVEKLQKQLEETRQTEIQEVEEERAKCQGLKESFSAAIPKTKKPASEELSGSVQQSKDIITHLKQENANRRKENQSLKVNLFDLHQRTTRLEKATLSTLNCVQELEEVHLTHETEKNEALYESLALFRAADDKMSSELDYRDQGGLMEHRICQLYHRTMDAIQELFQQSCDDDDLVLSITELPTVIVAMTSAGIEDEDD